jgi:hypothetical protein
VIANFRARCRENQVPPFSRHLDRDARKVTALSRPWPRKSRLWRIVAESTSPRDAA